MIHDRGLAETFPSDVTYPTFRSAVAPTASIDRKSARMVWTVQRLDNRLVV